VTRQLHAVILPVLLLAALGFWLRPRIVEGCAGSLVEIPEPANWHALPEVASSPDGNALGRFLFRGRSMAPKYQLAFVHMGLYDPAFCRSAGVGLERWFVDGPPPAYSRVSGELYLHENTANGDFIVAGRAWGVTDPGAEVFVTAFRRSPGWRPNLVSTAGAALGGVLLLGLLGSVLPAALAWWKLRRLTQLQDGVPHPQLSELELASLRAAHSAMRAAKILASSACALVLSYLAVSTLLAWGHSLG